MSTNGEPDLFNIDPNRLDSEWLIQPRTYRKEAEQLAKIRRQFEMAKADRDVTVAETAQGVRRNPAVYGVDKVTEKAVEEIVTIKSREAEQKVIDAKHALDVQQAMIDALDQRKHALEDLVKLRLAAYYADPKMPSGIHPDEVKKAMDRKPVSVEVDTVRIAVHPQEQEDLACETCGKTECICMDAVVGRERLPLRVYKRMLKLFLMDRPKRRATRKEILAGTNIAPGSLSALLGGGDFEQVEHGLWRVKVRR